MTAPALTLVTSIAPEDPRGVQATTIESWLSLGCRVLSVNAEAEIGALTEQFPSVTFRPAPRTGERLAGRPVPYIYDLLQALKADQMAAKADLVGIINADIFLKNEPNLLPFAAGHASGTVIMGPRVDVNSADEFSSAPEGNITYSVGYDYFLMDPALLDDFKDSPFCVGMPFWDYWLPLAALLEGRTLKALKSPVALHVTHETKWDDTIYVFFHALIAYVIEVCRPSGEGVSALDRQQAFLLDALSHYYADVFERGAGGDNVTPDQAGIESLAAFYDRFQETAVHHIKSRSETIRLSDR